MERSNQKLEMHTLEILQNPWRLSNVLDYCIARNGRACYLDSAATEIAKHRGKDSQQVIATEIFKKSIYFIQKIYACVALSVFG